MIDFRIVREDGYKQSVFPDRFRIRGSGRYALPWYLTAARFAVVIARVLVRVGFCFELRGGWLRLFRFVFWIYRSVGCKMASHYKR